MNIDVIEVTNCVYNVFVIKNDEYITKTISRGFEWDGWMREDVRLFHKKDTDIIDIGANIGYNTLLCFRLWIQYILLNRCIITS